MESIKNLIKKYPVTTVIIVILIVYFVYKMSNKKKAESSYRASTARTGPSASGRIKCGPGCKPFLGICWCVLPQEGAPPPVIKM
jgi:hypothetical protein